MHYFNPGFTRPAPREMYPIDQADYPKQPNIVKAADFMLTPLRVAFQGRTITCRGRELQIDSNAHSLAMRILAGIGALLLLPLTLIAYVIKWCCTEEVKDHLVQLMQAARPGGDGDIPREEPEVPRPSGFLPQGMPIVKIANFREPIIDTVKHEIEFLDFFEQSNEQEAKAWIEKVGELLKQISLDTGRKVCGNEYFGMGVSDYYFFDADGKCCVYDSESIKYDTGPFADYARAHLFQEDMDTYAILMPGRREVLEAFLG